MINIGTVYQKVLALANKEQRGYITPQEFNLFANMAQLEVFNQYFYDMNQFDRLRGNNTEYSDMVSLIEEKLSLFKKDAYLNVIGGTITLPNDLYRISSIHVFTGTTGTTSSSPFATEIQRVTHEELSLLMMSPLTIPTDDYPVYYIHGKGSVSSLTTPTVTSPTSLTLFPTNINQVFVDYIVKPTVASWGYVVLNTKALYNSNTSTDFDLHPLEETELVYKILKLAGISIKREDLAAAGQGLEMSQIQQEKQ